MPNQVANIFANHNHLDCLKSGLAEAQKCCADKGLRFTPIRQKVLELLLESHKALGAYDILDRLNKEGLGGPPPVVYRALAFLVEHGFAHKIERLNAFTACAHSGENHEPIFLICSDCHCIAEAPAAKYMDPIALTAEGMGFQITSKIVEVIGHCAACRDKAQQ